MDCEDFQVKFKVSDIPEERKQSPLEFSANFGVDLAFPDPEATDMLLDFLNDCNVMQKVEDEEKDVTIYLITHPDLPLVRVSRGVPLYSIRFHPDGKYSFSV